MVINGNVGIGATDPKEKLDVFGTIRLHGKNAFQGHDDFLRINQDNEFPNGTHFAHRANFRGGITTGDWSDVDPGVGNLLVRGNVGIGTVNPKEKLDVFGTIRLHGKNAFQGHDSILRINQDNEFRDGIYFNNYVRCSRGITIGSSWWSNSPGRNNLRVEGNVGIGIFDPDPAARLDVAGIVRAQSFVPSYSDARFKTDIMPLTNVLDKLEKIRGVSFKWNELDPYGRSEGGRDIGLIAQELEEVFPELITTWGNEGYLGIDYDRFTSVLLEAIKELRAENETFKVKIKALEDAMSRNGDT